MDKRGVMALKRGCSNVQMFCLGQDSRAQPGKPHLREQEIIVNKTRRTNYNFVYQIKTTYEQRENKKPSTFQNVIEL